MQEHSSEQTTTYIAEASPTFRQIFSDVERVVGKAFPQAVTVFEYGMPGWRVKLPIAERPPQGTMDANAMYILLVERKAGVTLHLMNPIDYYYLDNHKEVLSKAGFKVMRGCIQFNRKSPYPVAEVEKLLQVVSTKIASLDA